MRIPFLATFFAAAVVLAAGATARAEVRTYTLDPARSSLTFSGEVDVFPVTPQTAGSDTTRYSGSLMADVTATTIQFLDGGAMDAQDQLVAQQPRNGGTAFTPAAAADYGFNADSFMTTGRVAFRGFVLDLTSGVLARSGTSIPNGQTVAVESGTVHYRWEGLSSNEADSSGQGGEQAVNAAAAGTLSTVGNIETLTIPINAPFALSVVGISDSQMTLTGQIVATRVIPEPTSGGLLAVAAAAACALRRRRQFVRLHQS
jgi:hypothetical protein